MKRRALIVDDSATMRDMVSYTLSNAGFEVLEANDGQAALSVLDTERVNIIITDINMPVLDGIGLITKVRQHPVHVATPILCLTTEQSSDFKNKAKSAGATGWIEKPFNPDRLIQTINKVCV